MPTGAGVPSSRRASRAGGPAFWYRRGPGGEAFWTFSEDGSVNQLEPLNVSGTYDPVVLDVDGNGNQDIAWVAGGRATSWRFTDGGYSQSTYDSGLPNTFPAVGYTDPFDL